MNLTEFRDAIDSHPDLPLRIEIAGSGPMAPHFHVTEVGRVEKDFIDCGGKPRSEVRCVLQTLVAGDTEHRLNSTKLAGILRLTDRLGLPGDAPVDVEHQERSVSIDQVDSVEEVEGVLVIRATPKATACLAEDACGIPADKSSELLPIADTGCCSGSGGCG